MSQIPSFREWETSEEIKLSEDDLNFLRHTVNVDSRGKAKENSKIEIIPLGNDKFKLRAKSYVGSIKIPNSHIIQITPKIKAANFFKLLGYSENFSDIDFFKELGNAEEGDDLLDWIAKLFIRFVNEIIQEGIYKSYVSGTEEISTIKGRLLIVNNIRNPRITQEKFWCEFDELSTNTLENQILLYCSKLLFELVKDEKLKDAVKQIGLNPETGFGKALTQVYTGEVTTAAVSEYAKTEYGFEPTGMNEDVTHLSSTPVIKDDARSRVQSLDANSVSDVSDDEVLAQLQNIISKGSTKDAIRAKLTLMENAKNES